MLHLRAFAGLTLEDGGRPIAGAAAQLGRLAILAMLAAAGDRAVSRDRLLAVFWPDQDPESAHGALRQALYTLRRDTGERDLTLGTTELKLNPAVIGSDVVEFDEALKSRNLDHAVETYAGPLLDGIHLRDAPEFERWSERERERRADQYRAALEQLASSADARGDHAAAIDLWKRLSALDPLSARLTLSVMRAYVAAGDWPAALRRAQSHENLVRTELGTGPDPTVVALVQELRAGVDSDQASSDGRIPAARVLASNGASEPTIDRDPDVERAVAEPLVVPARRAAGARRLAGAAGVVLTIGAVWWTSSTVAGRPVPDIHVAPHRVAVATLQNRSGDASLDVFGMMAADWIARGLAATGAVDVAGTAAELQSRAGVTISTAGAVEQLGREARAGLVISGAFYRQGDSLLFQADFTDVVHSRLLLSVGPIATSAAFPIDGIETLSQRVTGALAPFLDSTLAGIAEVTTHPPNFEAYREFLRGEALYYVDARAAADAFLRASVLDPSYVYPMLRAIGVMENEGRDREVDSLLRVVRTRRASLTPYENAYLDFLTAFPSGNWPSQLAAVQRMHAAAPRSDFAKYLEANLLNSTRRPRAALALLEQLDPEGGALRGRFYYYYYLFSSLHALGHHEQTLEAMRRGRTQYPDRLMIIAVHALALAVVGRGSEVVALLDSIANRDNDLVRAPVDIATDALREAAAHDQRVVVESIRGWLRTRLPQLVEANAITSFQHADALAALEDWEQLAPFADSVARGSPDDVQMLGFLGLATAKLGDRARALDADRRLSKLRRPAYLSSAPPVIQRAMIAAALGEKDRAVRLLRTLSVGGWNQELWHDSPLFPMLRGFPPFEALLVPRG